MKRLFALFLLCLVTMLALPALAQKTPDKGDSPSADEIARRVQAAVAQGGSAEDVSQRIEAALDGTVYRVLDDVSNADPNSGGERILSYDIDVTANADNTLDVTETIRVVAQGIQVRRGLYRDFPTRYKDRYGNNVVVGFDVIGLKRDGKPEPWFTESMSNGVRVNFGNDDFLQTPATYTYTLSYRTNRQVGFFNDHDELYWNAIGTGWDFPIERANVTVHLPQPVPMAEMKAEGYTGPQGSKNQYYVATLPEPGVARWTLTQALSAREGLTIVLSFPKGIISAPSREQKVRWFLHDNRAILVGLGTLLLMFGYLLMNWFRIGRDPDPGVIIARYEPPAGYAPSELRFIKKMMPDDRCFTADLVDMAVRGLIHISSDKKVLGTKEWTLERTETQPGGDLPDVQRTLLNTLFAYDKTLTVKASNREKFMPAKNALFKSMDAAYNGRMFKRNGRPTGLALLIALAGMITAFVISKGAGTVILVLICVVMFVMLIVSAWLMAAPTPEGRKLLDEVGGLKLYLGVAERDDIARLQSPSLDAGRFESLLPYAIALDVEEAWTKKFTDAVGAAAAQQATSNMGWYSGASFASMNQFTSGLGSSFSSSISSASSPPGSSSGGGGGGSSGGGGGGGGGGGR